MRFSLKITLPSYLMPGSLSAQISNFCNHPVVCFSVSRITWSAALYPCFHQKGKRASSRDTNKPPASTDSKSQEKVWPGNGGSRRPEPRRTRGLRYLRADTNFFKFLSLMSYFLFLHISPTCLFRTRFFQAPPDFPRTSHQKSDVKSDVRDDRDRKTADVRFWNGQLCPLSDFGLDVSDVRFQKKVRTMVFRETILRANLARGYWPYPKPVGQHGSGRSMLAVGLTFSEIRFKLTSARSDSCGARRLRGYSPSACRAPTAVPVVLRESSPLTKGSSQFCQPSPSHLPPQTCPRSQHAMGLLAGMPEPA